MLDRAEPLAADFDLHGWFRLRVTHVPAAEVAAAAAALGLQAQPATGSSDVTVRATDRASIRTQLQLACLEHGILPLHASAFHLDGQGWAVTGERRSGKTGVLLGFLARGARFIGSEWVHVRESALYGRPEPVRVRARHLRELPDLKRLIPGGAMARIWALDLAGRVCSKLGGSRLGRRLEGRAWLDVTAAHITGSESSPFCAPFARLVWIVPSAAGVVRLVSQTPEDVATYMAASFVQDLGPDAERFEDLYTRLLLRALEGVVIVRVERPALAGITPLVDALASAPPLTTRR